MFNEFCNNVVAHFEQKGYTVAFVDVAKNNVVRNGFTICKKGERVCPTLYLDDIFKHNTSVENALAEIEKILAEQTDMQTNLSSGNILDRFSVDNLFVKVVCTESNSELLRDTVSRQFLDLSIVPYFLIPCDFDNGIASAKVTDGLLAELHLSVDEVIEKAIENTEKNLGQFEIKGMTETLFHILVDLQGMPKEIALAMLGLSSEDFTELRNEPMYIGGNKKAMYGASIMVCCKNKIKDLAESLDIDLYILPSSVHEVILVPCVDNIEREYLESMVCEVNATEVAEEDRLSNTVYVYRRDTDTVEIANI